MQETLLIAIALVVLVIFLFLRSVSATIIPALAVPISLIGTCAVMYAFGFSINNMTLLALTLSVGFVVDDAIVMLENIVRHIEGGMRPFEAALKGAREIGFTIISITFSLIAVFIPVLLMGGMVGRVFREFAVTIAVAIIMSGFVSLTLTPMLCARVLRAPSRGREAEHRAARVRGDVQRLAARLRVDARQGAAATSRSCCWSRSPRIVGTVWLYIVIPKGFFPTEDTGFMLGDHRRRRPTSRSTRWSSGSSRSPRSSAHDPAVDYVNSTVGVGGPNSTTNHGRMFVALKPKNEREPARRRDRSGCAARPAASPACSVYFQRDPEHQYRRPHRQGRVPVHAADRATPRRSTGVAPEMREKIAQDRRACATSTPTSTSRIRR